MPLEGLLPHLGPGDEDAVAALQEARRALDAAVAKIGAISLTQAAADKVLHAFLQGALPLDTFMLEADSSPLQTYQLCVIVNVED